MKLPLGTMILALGLTIGSGATLLVRPAAVASAAQSMGAMSMPSKSTGDSEMNAAMDQMSRVMASTKLTGAQDHDFMVLMIPHHQSAVAMAKIELRRGTHPELKALANEIVKSQGVEIGDMRHWLAAWYGQRS